MMAMTPEAKVKRVVTRQLKDLGVYYFYPVTGGYGSSGVPDIVGCYQGLFFGIECKAGKNKPTPLQKKNLEDIAKSGGVSLVVNEENMNLVSETLTKHIGDCHEPRNF
jgi:Holliday junction resolvase